MTITALIFMITWVGCMKVRRVLVKPRLTKIIRNEIKLMGKEPNNGRRKNS